MVVWHHSAAADLHDTTTRAINNGRKLNQFFFLGAAGVVSGSGTPQNCCRPSWHQHKCCNNGHAVTIIASGTNSQAEPIFLSWCYRRSLWFWDTIVLLQTFALACAQVFATSLNTYFQLTIMLMILVIGLTVLTHLRPFDETLSQRVQVSGMSTWTGL